MNINPLEWKKKGNFKIVVAIDFGTDGSALAWAHVNSNDENETIVHTEQEWNENSRFIDKKTKTTILLDENGECLAFGTKAIEKYTRQLVDDDDEDYTDDEVDEEEDNNNNNINIAEKPKAKQRNVHQWMYFSGFKMALYKQAIKRQTLIDDDSKNNAEKSNGNQNRTNIKSHLKAAGGRKWPSRQIFIQALKFMHNHALTLLKKKKIRISAEKQEIQWILTVPAIWNAKAKGLMESWATEAGLGNNREVMNQIVIAYEPDCAAISLQHEIADYKKRAKECAEQKDIMINNNTADSLTPKTKNKPKKNRLYLSPGEKYLLLDLGGGTADIAAHEIVNSLNVREVFRPSGGPWGSLYIDREFSKMFNNLFPNRWIELFQSRYPHKFVQFIDNFQQSKERFFLKEYQMANGQITDNPSKQIYDESCTHEIEVPMELNEFLEEKLEDFQADEIFKNRLTRENKCKNIAEYIAKAEFRGVSGRWTLKQNMLHLHYSLWIYMFDHIIDRIIDHCKTLLKKPELLNCQYLCLVGGFSSSKYLQTRVHLELGKKSEHNLIVILPRLPNLSVVDGAVRLGLRPEYISSRTVAKTYGIKVNGPVSKYNLNELPEKFVQHNIYFHPRHNQQWLHNIFGVYARKNSIVKNTDEPLTRSFYASKNNVIGIEVYESDLENPVMIEGDPIAKKDVELPPDWDMSTRFPISFFFGDTTIRVFAGIDGLEDHQKQIHLNYEF